MHHRHSYIALMRDNELEFRSLFDMCFSWMYALNAERWTCHFVSIKYDDHCWWFLFEICFLFTFSYYTNISTISLWVYILPARLPALSLLTAHCSHIVWIVIFICTHSNVFCIPFNHLCFDGRVMDLMTLSTKNETHREFCLSKCSEQNLCF